MDMQNKQNELLISEGKNFQIQLYFLADAFKVAEYWSYSESNRKLLKRFQHLEDVECYLDNIEYIEQGLEKWRSLNTLEDFIELKKILKNLYFAKESGWEIKQGIINAISAFPTLEDASFYLQVITSVSVCKDMLILKNIIFCCYKVLCFIENKNFQLEIMQISQNPPRQKIIYGDRCIFNCKQSYTTVLKIIKFFRNKGILVEFPDEFYENYFVETIENDHTKILLHYKLLNNSNSLKVSLIISTDDKEVLSMHELNMNHFLDCVNQFTEHYFSKEKTYTININVKSGILFETKYSNKYDRYLTDVFVNDEIRQKIDTRDLIFVFSNMLSNLTLICDFKYSLCLQTESKISMKKFIKLISLFDRAI